MVLCFQLLCLLVPLRRGRRKSAADVRVERDADSGEVLELGSAQRAVRRAQALEPTTAAAAGSIL